MSDPRTDPERPTLDEGELYVFTEEDIGAAVAEVYAHMAFAPELDQQRAEELADIVYQLLTGDWLKDP